MLYLHVVMTIALVHQHKAFLPVIDGYTHFFNGLGIRCEAVTPRELKGLEHQVEWHFMGIDRTARQPGIYKIHEYQSPSTPPFRTLKDLGKRWLNTRPDLRIYQNAYVQQCIGLHDAVPFCFQDMGLAEEWLIPATTLYKKEFDFIYVGELSPKRAPQVLLDRFTRDDMRDHTLLLLSRNYAHWQSQYKDYRNIVFKGPVSPEEVIAYMLRSRFGLNYMPDIEPYNQLTSTKFLEYAACDLPIISTDYDWVRNFQRDHGGKYLLVSPNLQDLTWERVIAFPFKKIAMNAWTWEWQLRQSGVLHKLAARFPDVPFQRL